MRLMLTLALAALAHGAGTVTQTMTKLGETDNYVITVAWTADASNGSVPATAMMTSSSTLASTRGFSIIDVITDPGSPAPTDNYDLTFVDENGFDVLEGACLNRSTSTTQSCSAGPHPIRGTVTVTWANNSVNSAAGTIKVMLVKITTARRGGGTAGGTAGGDLTGTYPNPSVATVGGETAASVAAGAVLANAATSANTADTIVKRGAAGEFTAGVITASTVVGNSSTASALLTNPADCGANQYATAIAANGDLTCAVPTVVENPVCTFTAESSKACTHNLASSNLIYACWDNASPAEWVNPLSVVKTNTNTATVTFAAAFTGTCYFNVGGGSGGGGGGGGITSLEGQTGATQTFTDDTNVTIVSGSNAHAITWAGTLAVARGGTGASTAAGAQVNLLPSYTGNTLKVLRVNAGETAVEWATVGGGGGSYSEGSGIDITGTVISVDPTVTATFLRGSFAYDFASITTGTCAQTTVTLSGAATGQAGVVAVSGAAFPVGVNLAQAKVTTTNTVAIELCNMSGSSYDPSADRTYTITLFQ